MSSQWTINISVLSSDFTYRISNEDILLHSTAVQVEHRPQVDHQVLVETEKTALTRHPISDTYLIVVSYKISTAVSRASRGSRRRSSRELLTIIVLLLLLRCSCLNLHKRLTTRARRRRRRSLSTIPISPFAPAWTWIHLIVAVAIPCRLLSLA